MDSNSVSSFFVNYTWAGNDGVNTDPSWHKAMERSHTPPLLKEICLTRSHIDFTFTSIEERPEKCGTSFNIPSEQSMWFVDEANSSVSHTCLTMGATMYIWYMSIPGEPMALKPYPPLVRSDKNVPESYQAKKTFDTRGRKCQMLWLAIDGIVPVMSK